MHTSGMVITFTDAPSGDHKAMTELSAAKMFTLGERAGRCLPVVLETADAESARRWHEWVEALPGVANVEVVFVHWDEVESEVNHASV